GRAGSPTEAEQPNRKGPDADGLVGLKPTGAPGLAVPEDARAALEVEAEEVPGDHLQVRVPPAHRRVVQAQASLCLPADQEERLFELPAQRLPTGGVLDAQPERAGGATGLQEQSHGLVGHDVTPETGLARQTTGHTAVQRA